MEQLEREIEQLEGRLDRDTRAKDELVTIRRGLAGARGPGIELTNLRIGFACKQRWDDMIGDDRVRVCAGCDRPVFNLSEMTRDDAEALLATRGLTPCVRFYRRPDGTVMTTDCPTGARPAPRRLAVVASSLAAAGTALAAPAMADPPTAGSADLPTDDGSGSGSGSGSASAIEIEDSFTMGVPIENTYEMGIMIAIEPRPRLEWSVWGRLGIGEGAQRPDVLARRLTPHEVGPGSMSEAAIGADLTVGVARDGDLRLGAWGEARTTTDPVAGAELVLEGLPPHPYTSRIDGTGSIVLRAGGNSRVITAALGFGYVGAFARTDPWIRWMRHEVGARVMFSVNRSIDDPRDWSATVGLEIDPIGAVHAVYDLVTAP